jgi:glyceraldehyde 3-phosphate dehydrogenase
LQKILKKMRIAINGLGRIGKLVLRLLSEQDDMQLVAVNDPMPSEILKNLLKYDTVHGPFAGFEKCTEDSLKIKGKKIALFHEKSPANLPWRDYDVDCVIEASGMFKTRQALEQHLASGAKKVLLSQPSADLLDRTIVIGVNEHELQSSDTIVSNASCTTNCLAPILKVLHEKFGIRKAFFNTVHPFTNNQSLMDGAHADPRRSRSAFCNIIPTTSTAVGALTQVMRELAGKIDGFATRVPVTLGSYIEITAHLEKQVNVEEINREYFKAVDKFPKGILEYCTDPIVSSDIIGNRHSAIFDSLCTRVLGGDMVQMVVWYDNETAYSQRVTELLSLL